MTEGHGGGAAAAAEALSPATVSPSGGKLLDIKSWNRSKLRKESRVKKTNSDFNHLRKNK